VGGYELVSEVDAVEPGTARIAFSEPYGPWPSLFGRLLPAHADSIDVTISPGTGAFRIVDWIPGDRIVVQRIEDWWSPVDPISDDPTGDVEEITFVFIDDLSEMIDALDDGTVDVIAARPDPEAVARLEGLENVAYAVSAGSFWEHVDFHHEDELLARDWVREALDLAIDRQKILDRTVGLLSPTLAALDNTVWMANTEWYEPHYIDRHDAAAAERLLIENGCVRDGDIQTCGDRELSFVWTSTNDDPTRLEIFESVREDLEVIGVEIVGDFRSPSSFVTREHLFGGPGVWQLINFSWRADGDPSAGDRSYYCDDTELNVNRYCSPAVEELVRRAGTLTVPGERAAVYNEADRLYLEDRALIPLYQKPELMAWSTDIAGVSPNYTPSSVLWNIAAWRGKQSIVVALESEPRALDPLSTSDESANVVMATLLYGAFGMDPSSRKVPALVDSVEIVSR